MVEPMLFLLEDLLQVEKILLFRSVAREIATDRSAILTKIVFGSVDNLSSIPFLTMALSRIDLYDLCRLRSMANRTHGEENGSLKRPVHSHETTNSKSVDLCISFSLNKASFQILSSTGSASINGDLYSENSSISDVSVLTMGSFGVSSYTNNASECRLTSFEQGRSDGRSDIFIQKNQSLFLMNVGTTKAQFSSHPDYVYSFAIESVTCSCDDAEILTFQPMNSGCESRAKELRQSPDFFIAKLRDR
jgi:hypothetical protein